MIKYESSDPKLQQLIGSFPKVFCSRAPATTRNVSVLATAGSMRQVDIEGRSSVHRLYKIK